MAPNDSSFHRFEVVGTTPHRHEREGIDWLRAALPQYDPFGGYALFTFQTDDNRRYEVDAIVLTSHCLFMIELKAWSGEIIQGDVRHLVTWSVSRGREVVDHPLPLLEVKAKNFMDRVRRVARQGQFGRDVADAMHALWCEPLVWLTHAEGTKLHREDAALSHVLVGRGTLGDALRQARFPGAADSLKDRQTTSATFKALRKVLGHPAFGLNPIDKPTTVLDGRIALTSLLEEGDAYQDHRGEPVGVGPTRRVRSYMLPKSDRAYAAKLERRVEREAKVLMRLGDHPNVLAFEAFDARGPLGPALVFRNFEGKALDAFVKEQRDADGRSTLTLDDRLAILRHVADALAFCHRSDVRHGALSPEAVLVHRKPGTNMLEVRLTRFALASAADPQSEGTRLFTRLAGATANLYEAPEIALGALPTVESDFFSLGAVAYFLLAEQPPAETSVELTQRLLRDQALTISSVRDDLFPPGVKLDLDRVLFEATFIDPSERMRNICSPLELIERLEEALTTPDTTPLEPQMDSAAPAEVDPLEAGRGTVLPGGIEVLSVLGSGATARVLKVRLGDDELALKVPLSDAHDERVRREGEVLARLHRQPGIDRVAHWIDTRTIAGRSCLLVQFAGDRTLADEIRLEGSISLDYARRWGEDLLTAVRSLEGAGVQHRDIKPANIGLTAGAEKKRKGLLLFDFSLSDRPAEDVGMGTPAYKDPALVARGRWDDAADRWAAAITLHEMFTGVRPAPIPGAAAGTVAVRVEADRIDADVRDGLKRFFHRAFQWSKEARFATAEEMREAFSEALRRVPSHEAEPGEEPALTPADLVGLGPEAKVRELSLSTRQRNALDRMGIYTLHELSELPTNRLSAVRGVGAKTARSLVLLAEVVRRHLSISATEQPAPFLRGFNGARVHLESQVEPGKLSRPLVTRLLEAGLDDSVALASAPQAQIKNLVTRAKKEGASESTKELTQWLESLVDAERAPSTIGAAAALLAPRPSGRSSPSSRRLRHYLGLEPIAGYPRHGSATELAKACGVTRALISLELIRTRERWTGKKEGPVLGSEPEPPTRERLVLERALTAVLAALSAGAGVLPMPRAAAAVLEALPPEPDLSVDAAREAAEAVVRALSEISLEDLGVEVGSRLFLRRHKQRGEVLIASDKAGFALCDLLGRVVDRAVDQEGVLSEAAACERLREALRDSSEIEPTRALAASQLPDRTLVTLSTATAERARVSARGELYQEGLSAERAIVLTAPALTTEMTADELRRRVLARYPHCTPLPEDPATLAKLTASVRMQLDAAGNFVPRDRTLGVGGTEYGSGSSASSGSQASPAPAPSQAGTAAPAPKPAPRVPPLAPRERAATDVAGATAIRAFDDELDAVLRDGGFRVLLWRGHRAAAHRTAGRGAPNDLPLAEALAKRARAELLPLDRQLVSAAELIAAEKKVHGGLARAVDADASGPGDPSWGRLLDLMKLAAERVFAKLVELERPRVLLHLGLHARYGLLGDIDALAERHRRGKLPAATLVVLPVLQGEHVSVEVAADVAARAGAMAGTRLVPLHGVLPFEIVEVPPQWVDAHVAKRSTSSPPLVAAR